MVGCPLSHASSTCSSSGGGGGEIPVVQVSVFSYEGSILDRQTAAAAAGAGGRVLGTERASERGASECPWTVVGRTAAED